MLVSRHPKQHVAALSVLLADEPFEVRPLLFIDLESPIVLLPLVVNDDGPGGQPLGFQVRDPFFVILLGAEVMGHALMEPRLIFLLAPAAKDGQVMPAGVFESPGGREATGVHPSNVLLHGLELIIAEMKGYLGRVEAFVRGAVAMVIHVKRSTGVARSGVFEPVEEIASRQGT